MATGTLALDIAVGQEFLRFFIIELFRLEFYKLTCVIELAEEVRGVFLVRVGSCARIHVEGNAEIGK